MAVSIIILTAVIIFSVGIGSVKIAPTKVFNYLFFNSNLSETEQMIIDNVRLPRVVLALIVGMALASSGALLQAVMQNPLADPGIIGVSSGASLGIMTVLLVMPHYAPVMPLIAFGGGIMATIIIYLLSWKNGINTIRLILAGVAVNAILGGASSLISVLNSEKVQNVILWLNGTLAGRSWKDVYVILPYVAIGLLFSILLIGRANIILLGDEKATNLGLNIHSSRIYLSLVAAFLAGVATSSVGVIGFIGLVVPHISRLIVGTDYRRLLPFSIINGGTFLILTDTFARTISSPLELPVGTIMAVLGGPFFLYLLRRGKK